MAKRQTYRTFVATDTATLAVFDPARLRHRLGDPADWWTWPAGVLVDLNKGNIMPVDLGADGVYEVTIHLNEERPDVRSVNAISGFIACEGEEVFIGPGEEITADGLEPGGFRLPCRAGTYRVWVAAKSWDELEVWMEPSQGPPVNQSVDYPRLRYDAEPCTGN